MTITAVGSNAVLDTNDLGVGVNSPDDDFTWDCRLPPISSGSSTALWQRPEAIHFSFDEDVSLESMTVGSLDLDGMRRHAFSFRFRHQSVYRHRQATRAITCWAPTPLRSTPAAAARRLT